MNEIIYAGSGKTINGRYGDFDSITIDVDLCMKHSYKGKDGKNKVTLNIGDKKEPDQFGNNKKVTVNQYKPQEVKEVSKADHSPDRDDDLPF